MRNKSVTRYLFTRGKFALKQRKRERGLTNRNKVAARQDEMSDCSNIEADNGDIEEGLNAFDEGIDAVNREVQPGDDDDWILNIF